MRYYENNKNGADNFIFPEMKKADFSNAKAIYHKIKVVISKFNKDLKSIVKKSLDY